MRAKEFVTERRDRMYQYIRSIVPTWPEYIVKDWLYANQAKPFGRQSNITPADRSFETLRTFIPELLADIGLTVDTKWQLVPNMKFTMDMWEPKTKQRLIARAGGKPTELVPSTMAPNMKDAERHATQASLAKQQGGIRKEPVIIIKTPQGYELLEGWHRTIQHFAAYPDGYTGPAYVAVSQGQHGVAEGANWDDEEDALVEALEEWMMMQYDDQTIKTILSSPEAEPYKDPPGGVQWLYRAIVPRDREFNSIKASGPVIAFATEMAGAITFIESLETSDDWVIIRKPFNPADFVLDFTDMYEAFVEPDNDPMSRYEVEHEVWMKAVPAYTKSNKQEIVYTSKEHYGDNDWRKDDYKPKSTAKSDLRRPEDEPAIMQNPGKAYHYAKDVIKGRWPEAEPYIIQGAKSIIQSGKSMSDSIGISILVGYARDVIGGRWPEAEPVIMKNPEYAYQYARDVIEGRWPEAEPYIRQDPVWALFYAQKVIGGRWPEAEPEIMKNPQSAYQYARDVIQGRWPEAEPVIMKFPSRWAEYTKLFNLDTPAQNMAENFADGKNPGRKGLAKRSGVNTKASVSSLRKTAKNSSGEKQRMAHWLANMKAGRAKAKK